VPARFAVSSSVSACEITGIDDLLIPGISQVELGFYNAEDLPLLRQFLNDHQLRLGLHDPLVKPAAFSWPAFTGPTEEMRHRSAASLVPTMETAAAWGAEYVVVHIPSLVFPGDPVPTVGLTWEMAMRSGAELEATSRKYGIPVLVENVGPNPTFQTVEDWERFFAAFPSLRFCNDLGHLQLLAGRTGIDPIEFTRRLAPITASAHVYNARMPEYQQYRHIPMHPSLRPEEGWADIPALLASLLAGNPDCLLVLEHNVYYPGGKTFAAEGVVWVRQVVADLEARHSPSPAG
jgi:sugar phosphate isomerase/epimerase